MKTKDIWRIGIQDKKNWSKWYWSAEFDSFELVLGSIQEWLATHPGWTIKFVKQTKFLPE